MQIPFTVEQFYGVFSAYNMAIWPAQIFLLGLALIAIALLAAQRRFSGVGISGILAFLWAWQALAYHLAFLPPSIRWPMRSPRCFWQVPSFSFGKVLFAANLISRYSLAGKWVGPSLLCLHSPYTWHGLTSLATATRLFPLLDCRAPPRYLPLVCLHFWSGHIRAAHS